MNMSCVVVDVKGVDFCRPVPVYAFREASEAGMRTRRRGFIIDGVFFFP